jgi:hypothetical protein
VSRTSAALAATVVALLGVAAAAQAKPMRELARISVPDAVINEGFALDERGARLAYVVVDARGAVRLRVGPAGKAAGKGTDVTRFSTSPEQVLSVGAGWFVIANEGKRRALAVGPSGAAAGEIGPFSDAFGSTARGPMFVAVTDRGDRPEGHVYDVAAYRPGGMSAGRKSLVVAGDGTIKGSGGLVFQSFTNGCLQAIVKKPGKYEARADVRGTVEIATFDVLSGAVSGAHRLGDLQRYSDVIVKRNEKPGFDAFVRLDDEASGLELVGPGEKVRRLAWPGKLAGYDAASLDQQRNGGRLYFALVLDPAGAPEPTERKGPRLLHIFEVALAGARATLLGEIPLGDDKAPFVWAAGGDKVAFMRKGTGGGEIVVYGR